MNDLYDEMQPCIPGSAFTFPAFLFRQDNAQLIQINPTLTTADVLISVDGGGYTSVDSLPVEVGSTGELTVTLNALETTGATKYINVKFSDVAGGEWCDVIYVIETEQAKSLSVAVSATVAASVSSGSLAIETANTFRQSITSTLAADLSAATKLWLAIKSSEIVGDAASTIFVEKTGGLTVVNGAPYATIANGSLTVSGLSGAWSVAIYLSEVVTALLSAGKYIAELKAKIGTDEVSVWAGDCVITTGVVQTL
jgi:hypothetical protein